MEDRLYIKLYQLRRRQAWVSALQSGMRAGLWGGWLSVGAVGALAWLGLPVDKQLEGLLLWPTLAGAGFLRGLLHPMTLRQVAHRADQAHGLQERLLTCYGNLESQRSGGAVSRLLLQDTLEQLDRIDPRVTFPNRWQRSLLRWTVPLLAVLALVTVLPFGRVRPDPQELEVLASRERLSRLAQRLHASRPHSRRSQELQKLLRQMPHQVPRQAARQLRQELKQVQRQLARQAGQTQQLESMLQDAQRRSAPNTAAQQAAAKQLEQLRRQMEAQHSAQPSLQRAQEALRGGNSEQARKELEKALEQLQRGAETQEAQELSQALQDELGQLAPQSGMAQDPEGSGAGPVQLAEGKPGGQKGEGKADFGQGSTNQATGESKSATSKQRASRQSQQQRDKRGEYERLYGAERHHVELRRESAVLSGAKGKLLVMQEAQLGAAREGDPSQRAANDEFLAAKALAEQSVAEERIPAEHRDAVRRYFDRIDPR